MSLALRAGDSVRVKSREEIFATLDGDARLDGMPFMPEMLQFCGRTFIVLKRADKTCDYVGGWSLRRLRDSVHLDTRCDGSGHGGCQAECLIFWKEAWLQKVDTTRPPEAESSTPICTEERVWSASRSAADPSGDTYSCQTTTLKEFSTYLPWWDLRQYIRDVRSGNLTQGWASSRSERLLETLMAIGQIFIGLTVTVFNRIQVARGQTNYPNVEGRLERTPTEVLNLKAGDLVQVKSRAEILATLDGNKKNRGLLYDGEMLPYCGGTYAVRKRVERILDEKTGRLITMPRDCIMLEGVTCRGDFHMHCPRGIYAYWREIWLRKVGTPTPQAGATSCAVSTSECS
jgi:hypothetical protein